MPAGVGCVLVKPNASPEEKKVVVSDMSIVSAMFAGSQLLSPGTCNTVAALILSHDLSLFLSFLLSVMSLSDELDAASESLKHKAGGEEKKRKKKSKGVVGDNRQYAVAGSVVFSEKSARAERITVLPVYSSLSLSFSLSLSHACSVFVDWKLSLLVRHFLFAVVFWPAHSLQGRQHSGWCAAQ